MRRPAYVWHGSSSVKFGCNVGWPPLRFPMVEDEGSQGGTKMGEHGKEEGWEGGTGHTLTLGGAPRGNDPNLKLHDSS